MAVKQDFIYLFNFLFKARFKPQEKIKAIKSQNQIHFIDNIFLLLLE